MEELRKEQLADDDQYGEDRMMLELSLLELHLSKAIIITFNCHYHYQYHYLHHYHYHYNDLAHYIYDFTNSITTMIMIIITVLA